MKLLGYVLMIAFVAPPLHAKAPLHVRIAQALGLNAEATAAIAQIAQGSGLYLHIIAQHDGYKQFKASLDETFAAVGDNGHNLQQELGRMLKGKQGGVQAVVDALLSLESGELTTLLHKAARDLKLVELLAAVEEINRSFGKEAREKQRQLFNTVENNIDIDTLAASIVAQLDALWAFELQVKVKPLGSLVSISDKVKELQGLAEDEVLIEASHRLRGIMKNHIANHPPTDVLDTVNLYTKVKELVAALYDLPKFYEYLAITSVVDIDLHEELLDKESVLGLLDEIIAKEANDAA